MRSGRWYEVRCDVCVRRLLVPEYAAMRIADDVSFALCIRCADEYEAATGHEPVAEFPEAPAA